MNENQNQSMGITEQYIKLHFMYDARLQLEILKGFKEIINATFISKPRKSQLIKNMKIFLLFHELNHETL